jgi:hypothetical protein
MNRPRCATLFQVATCALLLGSIAGTSCRRAQPVADERVAPNPNAPAVYGPPAGRASKEIPRLLPSGSQDTLWKSKPFYLIQTELSPATLIHSSAKYLGLFSGLTNYGLGAPTHVAWSTMNGPRAFERGEKLDVTKMEECWLLVWWAGAEGWTNWDSPWVVYLQHKPDSMKLDQDGLHLDFLREAGDVVVMPLYGYQKLPQQGRDFQAEYRLPAKKDKIKTWEWAEVLTRDPLTRVRYWASATREFPIHCEETFSVNRATDSVTIRSRFERRAVNDDWQTPHLKLAPLSPPLAHAAREGGFPVAFSAPWLDLDLFTPYGPYLAIEGRDTFETTFSLLQYINETEAVDEPVTNAHPSVQVALNKLERVAAAKFANAGGSAGDPGPASTIQGEGGYARALSYYEPTIRSNAVATLRRYFRDEVLVTNRFTFQEFPKGSGREYFTLEGTDIRSAEAGKLNANLIGTLWGYAHFTGDWELIKERWLLVKKLFIAPVNTRWVGFGADANVELGAPAAHCAAFARLAYRAGDLDSYHYACHQFARELVHLFLKQRGGDYFRQHQPVHSMEFIDDEVFLTHVAGEGVGWRMDGPKFPREAKERRFNDRWIDFNDADVARFYREYLKPDVRRELNWLQNRWEPNRKWHHDPSLMPSLVQLRSLLLNESPAELANVATADRFTGTSAGISASCLAVLRTSHPTRFERLIPPGEPAPFVTGLERDVAGWPGHLVVSLAYQTSAGGEAVAWPQLRWPEWKAPSGEPWTFGHIRSQRGANPRVAKVTPINWNTRVVSFDF